jgi:integrase
MTREDIEGFVEHEQDRGLKPNSVRTRMCAVYAFVHFLIEKKVVSYELLERRIKLKLPDRLPRAIDPEDLKQLLSVIDHVRNRALILLLLRTGMRIGELLNTKVDDVDLREQKIFIYQADKTGVGRVVYYSDDAQAALLAWLKVRDPFKENLFYGQGRQSLSYEGARSMFNKYLQLVSTGVGYVAGLSGVTLPAFRAGCTLVLVPELEADNLLQAIDRFHVDTTLVLPTMLLEMLESPLVDKLNLSSLKACFVAGDESSHDLYQRFRKRMGHDLLQAFGMTECEGYLSNRPSGPNRNGTVGKPAEGIKFDWLMVMVTTLP